MKKVKSKSSLPLTDQLKDRQGYHSKHERLNRLQGQDISAVNVCYVTTIANSFSTTFLIL